MDTLTTTDRSALMARVGRQNTTPELITRRVLHSLGLRFRINQTNLPGSPDIVLAKYHSVVFVNGCFWHGHRRCRRSALPKSNTAYWRNKIEKNRARDQRVQLALKEEGWKVYVVWECETRDIDRLSQRFKRQFRALT